MFQVVLENIEQVVWQSEGAVTFAVLLNLGEHSAQRVAANVFLSGDLFLEFAQPICFFPVAHDDPFLAADNSRNATAIGAGHIFVIAMTEGYPINVLGRIKDVAEVCSIYCATANPVEVIVAQTEQGRGVLGVVDGSSPQGVEDEAGAQWRHGLLRKIGYKK